MKKVFKLIHQAARDGAAAYCQQAPEGWWVTFSEPVKSREQEEKYHAIIGEIAESELLLGQKLTPESWKRLLIDAFKHETTILNPGNYPGLAEEWVKFGELQLVPALNHAGFVMVGEQSRKFSKRLAGAFITWLQAFQDGVR